MLHAVPPYLSEFCNREIGSLVSSQDLFHSHVSNVHVCIQSINNFQKAIMYKIESLN